MCLYLNLLNNQVKSLRDENTSLKCLYTPGVVEGWGAGLEHYNSGSLSSSPLHHPHHPQQQHLAYGASHSVSGSPRHQFYSPGSYNLHNGECSPHVSF